MPPVPEPSAVMTVPADTPLPLMVCPTPSGAAPATDTVSVVVEIAPVKETITSCPNVLRPRRSGTVKLPPVAGPHVVPTSENKVGNVACTLVCVPLAASEPTGQDAPA